MLPPRAEGIWATVLCLALAAIFAVTSWTAVRGKSYTPDEPVDSLDGWFMLYQHDFRFSDVIPPLWEYWITLPANGQAIQFDRNSREYKSVQPIGTAPYWSHRVPLWMMQRGRMMCLILGVALALLIGRWAWELGGLVPCVAATVLYCFDPNFLGHAALAKNDVASALFYVATAYAAWRAGNRLTWANAIAVAVLTAITVLTKFSGPLLAPALILMLGMRAILKTPWPILNRSIGQRLRGLIAAAAICLLTILVTYFAIWASYDFRFNSGPDGMNASTDSAMRSMREINAQNPAWTPPLATRLVLAAEKHRLIPEAFAVGLICTQVNNDGIMTGYLLGNAYSGGTWKYFPLAFLFKEPLATIAAAAMAAATGAWTCRRIMNSFASRWMAVCLAVPGVVYLSAALMSQMNIGFRHLFPVLPFLYIAISLAAARIWSTVNGRLLVILLGGALVAETLAAYPDFLAFFNLACASDRSWYLADSNLDWGQDLPALAAWQRQHPEVTVYLNYFGHDTPDAYGVHAVDLSTRRISTLGRPAVLAVSVTLMQLGSYDADAFRRLGVDPASQPEELLHNTICIFQAH
jgi:hypothetical protein